MFMRVTKAGVDGGPHQDGSKALLDCEEGDHDDLKEEQPGDDLLVHLCPHLQQTPCVKLKLHSSN